jgi:hypothetical protein
VVGREKKFLPKRRIIFRFFLDGVDRRELDSSSARSSSDYSVLGDEPTTDNPTLLTADFSASVLREPRNFAVFAS